MHTRVVVIDDHALVRSALCRALNEVPDMSVVGTSDSMDRAIAVVAEAAPDVALVDLRLGRERPVERMQELRDASPATQLLVLTAWATRHGVEAALAAGARGVLSKSQGFGELVAGVRRAHAGEIVICPELLPALIRRATAPTDGELDDRDFRVLELLVDGRTTGEMAAHLYLSERTVRNRVRMLMAKLGVHTRAEAVAQALRLGLVPPAEPDPPAFR